MQDKAKESCMAYFRLLHSFLQVLSYNKLKINGGFERAFETLFEQDVQTFTCSMLLNLDQLEKQLVKEEVQETESMDAFRALKTQFQLLINFQDYFDYFDNGPMIRSGTKSDKHDTSSSSGTYITHAVDADIRLVNDQVSFAEVDSNTTHDSTNMSHRGGEIDQDAEQYQVKSPLLNAELFKTKEMIEKETYNELSHRLQNTANGSTLNPKRTSQTSRSFPTAKSSCVTITVVPNADHSRNSSSFSDSKHFFCSTCHKCVFNANHDACITKLLNEVNSRKVKPHKTKNSNEPVEQKSHTQKPDSWIFTNVGLKWIPTGKMFTDSTTKVGSEPPNGSNEDITNPYECEETLNGFMEFKYDDHELWHLQTTLQAPFLKEKKGVRFSALYLQKKRNLLVFDHSHQHPSNFPMLVQSLSGSTSGLVQNLVSPTTYVPPSKRDYEILFQPLFDEYLNPLPCVVSPDPVAVAALRPVDPAGSPLSTTIDQDVPSASTSPTN
ncbi:hypothetical protein Tco_0078996 [Tanacetum coccineum]